MKRTTRERMFDWAFPTGAAAIGAALALIAYGRGAGIAEAKADVVRARVDVIEVRSLGDHDILLRVDERTDAMVKRLDKVADFEKLAAEIAAFRKLVEDAKALAAPAAATITGSPTK